MVNRWWNSINEKIEETNFECINLKQFGIYSLFSIEYANVDMVNAFTIAFICELKNPKNFKANDGESIIVE